MAQADPAGLAGLAGAQAGNEVHSARLIEDQNRQLPFMVYWRDVMSARVPLERKAMQTGPAHAFREHMKDRFGDSAREHGRSIVSETSLRSGMAQLTLFALFSGPRGDTRMFKAAPKSGTARLQRAGNDGSSNKAATKPAAPLTLADQARDLPVPLTAFDVLFPKLPAPTLPQVCHCVACAPMYLLYRFK